MKKSITLLQRFRSSQISLALFLFFGFVISSSACTIFVLTDENNTLFFNNEDYSNPNTRIWFQSGGEGYYGAAYVGFDNGWGQGGVNTEGLAYDWFAGGKVDYVPDTNLVLAKQNACQRMLETCATVDEAIDFFKTYLEIGFSEATILIADKSGASVVIGARNGEIFFDKSNKNAAIGYGLRTFNNLHGREAAANLADGTEILRQCVQKGKYATKYSSVYDLKTGQITVNQFLNGIESVHFNLFEELEKGGHYYDIPKINQQIKKPLKPLLFNQQRLSLYDFEELTPSVPKITGLVKNIIQNSTKGTLNPDRFTLDFWNILKKEQEGIKAELGQLGSLNSLHLIKEGATNNLTTYSYIIIFENARVLMQFIFDEEQKVHDIKTVTAHMTNFPIRTKVKHSFSGILKNILTSVGILIVGVLTFAFIRKKMSALS